MHACVLVNEAERGWRAGGPEGRPIVRSRRAASEWPRGICTEQRSAHIRTESRGAALRGGGLARAKCQRPLSRKPERAQRIWTAFPAGRCRLPRVATAATPHYSQRSSLAGRQKSNRVESSRAEAVQYSTVHNTLGDDMRYAMRRDAKRILAKRSGRRAHFPIPSGPRKSLELITLIA